VSDLDLRRPADVQRWLLQAPSLAQVRREFPEQWQQVEAEVGGMARQGDRQQLLDHLHRVAGPGRPTRDRARAGSVVAAEAVRRYLTIEAVRQACLSAASGVPQGQLRFNLVNGWVLQRLLFERGLRRKAVRAPLFRLVWPLLPQRRYLMPLVMPEGIYCFYSGAFLRALAALLGGEECLEIAAGDGTLTRLLAARGVRIVGTDDHSWSGSVTFDDEVVQREDAAVALRRRLPTTVLCAWPPPGNTFERQVFATPSVQRYVLVTSRHEFAAGDWTAYRRQEPFVMERDERLSSLLLPREADAVVYVFRRRDRGRT